MRLQIEVGGTVAKTDEEFRQAVLLALSGLVMSHNGGTGYAIVAPTPTGDRVLVEIEKAVKAEDVTPNEGGK